LKDKRSGKVIHTKDELIEMMANVLREYEKLEADIIINGNWGNGMAETPRFTPDQWQWVIEIQALRNEAMEEMKGVMG
jgi:hypothetical protein